MRWSWSVAFVLGGAAGFAAGRFTGGASETDTVPHDDARGIPAGPAAPPADVRPAAPGAVEAAPLRRSGPRAAVETRTPPPPAAAGSLAARIAAAQPDGAPVACPPAASLSRDELCDAVRALLTKRLSLERGAGKSLRDVLQRFVTECPDVPLDRDDVTAFAWQDGSGLGWLLFHHVPRDVGVEWFESLLLGGPPANAASWGARQDGSSKLLGDAIDAYPDRVRAAILRALAHDDSAVRNIALPLAERCSPAFDAHIAAAALTEPVPDVRAHALSVLANVADRTGDRAALTHAVVAAAESPDDGLRERAFDLLSRAGPAGLAFARAALERGGLSADEERSAIEALIRGGRAADLLGEGLTEARAVALIDAASDLADYEKNLPLLAGLAERAAELHCPSDREHMYGWTTLMCALGRADLAFAVARDASRPVIVRVQVLDAVLDCDKEPLAAVTCAAELLADPASKPDLRRGIVDSLVDDCGDSPEGDAGGAARTKAIEVLRRVAAEDSNTSVRSVAAAYVRGLDVK